MLDLSQELIPLIQTLIPGFLMTMTFYWFAEVPKPNQFERTLQALVGTAVIQALIYSIEQFSYWAGSFISLGTWSVAKANLLGIIVGGVSGAILAYCCNKDLIYSAARRLRITTKASTNDITDTYQKLGRLPVVLHFKDERRLMGYVEKFPSNSQNSSFLITQPDWLVEEKIVNCVGTYAMLINSSDVQWVEFLEGEEPEHG